MAGTTSADDLVSSSATCLQYMIFSGQVVLVKVHQAILTQVCNNNNNNKKICHCYCPWLCEHWTLNSDFVIPMFFVNMLPSLLRRFFGPNHCWRCFLMLWFFTIFFCYFHDFLRYFHVLLRVSWSLVGYHGFSSYFNGFTWFFTWLSLLLSTIIFFAKPSGPMFLQCFWGWLICSFSDSRQPSVQRCDVCDVLLKSNLQFVRLEFLVSQLPSVFISSSSKFAIQCLLIKSLLPSVYLQFCTSHHFVCEIVHCFIYLMFG